MHRYYDIHTHNSAVHTGTLSIVNLYEQFSNAGRHVACSVGLHPWYLQNMEHDWQTLQTTVTQPYVIAIGECGLDKVCDTDWQLQLTAFERQIQLANTISKPLIIHCVRAFDEVMAMLDKKGASVPVVFHGYNKKSTVAQSLLNKGYYLSFGQAILQDGTPAAQVLSTVPADKFLLETDDSKVDIKDIYKRAAEIRKTTEDAIILQVQDTFKKITDR